MLLSFVLLLGKIDKLVLENGRNLQKEYEVVIGNHTTNVDYDSLYYLKILCFQGHTFDHQDLDG